MHRQSARPLKINCRWFTNGALLHASLKHHTGRIQQLSFAPGTLVIDSAGLITSFILWVRLGGGGVPGQQLEPVRNRLDGRRVDPTTASRLVVDGSERRPNHLARRAVIDGRHPVGRSVGDSARTRRVAARAQRLGRRVGVVRVLPKYECRWVATTTPGTMIASSKF